MSERDINKRPQLRVAKTSEEPPREDQRDMLAVATFLGALVIATLPIILIKDMGKKAAAIANNLIRKARIN